MGRVASSSFISPSLSLSLRNMSTATATATAIASASAPPAELQKFEADLAERLEHLRLATNPPNLNWISDAMAVLLSTHASATATIFPALRRSILGHDASPMAAAAAAATRQLIQEHLDSCVGLLDVCHALKTAAWQLEEHLGQLDHALARAGEACSNATANGAALMQAAGRRLGSCLPPPPPPGLAQAQAQAQAQDGRRPMKRRSHPPLPDASSSSSSPTSLAWQQTLADAHRSLHHLKKRITSPPPRRPPAGHSSRDDAGTPPLPLLRSVNATTLTAALLLSALTSTLMGLSGSSSSSSSNEASWWSRSRSRSRSGMTASGRQRRRRHCCMLSPSSVSNLGGRDCRWALPLQEIQRDLVAHEAAEWRSGGQLDQVYVLGRTACVALLRQRHKNDDESGAALVLVKLGMGSLAKEVGEMRGSIAALRAQAGILCQAMAGVRAGLLEATSSSVPI